MLGIIASAVLAAIGTVWRWELTDRQRLGAAEVANRVMIAYIDDKTSLRDLPDTIIYDGARYRWSSNIERVSIRDEHPEERNDGAGTVVTIDVFDRMQAVTITAWVDDGSRAALSPGRTPTASVDRLINPLDFVSSDATERMLQDPEQLELLLRELVGADLQNPSAGSDSGDHDGRNRR